MLISWHSRLPARGGGETVDAGDLKSPGATHEGSIPSRPTSSKFGIPVFSLRNYFPPATPVPTLVKYFCCMQEKICYTSPRFEGIDNREKPYALLTRSKLPSKICYFDSYKKGHQCQISTSTLILLKVVSRL